MKSSNTSRPCRFQLSRSQSYILQANNADLCSHGLFSFLSFFLFFSFFFVRRRGELFSFFFGSLYFDSKEYSVRSWSVDRRIAYWQPLYHTAKDSFSMTGRLKISYSPLSDLNPLVGNSAKSLLIVRGNGSRGVVMLSDGRLGDEREWWLGCNWKKNRDIL